MINTPALRFLGLRAALFGAAIAALLAAPAAQATTYTFSGTASGDVALSPNWTPSGPPGASDIAEWVSGSVSANFTTASQTWGEIQITNPAALITLASPSGVGLGFGLTLGGVSNTTGVNIGIDMSGASKGLTMANLSSLTLATSQTWLTKTGDPITLTGNGGIAFGANVLTVDGGGVVAFTPITSTAGTKSSSSTGAGLVINGSQLTLSMQNNFASGTYANPLGGSTALTMAGSTMASGVATNNSGTSTQTFTGTTLAAGSSLFQMGGRVSSSSLQVNLGAISRNAGGLADFTVGGSTQNYRQATNNTGVLGYAPFHTS
jgi:hypothetical protein